MRQHAVRIALVILFAASVGGCGFHLRGYAEVSPQFERTLLEADRLDPGYRYQLQRTLQNSGVQFVDSLEQATGILTVVSSSGDRRVLSVDSDGKVSEYELIERLEIAARQPDGGVVFERRTLTTRRTYRFDRDLVLGTEGEERVLREEMREELAGLVALSLQAGP